MDEVDARGNTRGIEQEAAARLGQRVGPYLLERVLGVGGMAAVYLARRADGERAALKVLHPDLAELPEVRKRFLRESLIGSALGGGQPIPGAVRVYEAGETEDGVAYLAMEPLEGETLFDRFRRGENVFSAVQVLAIADQVLEGLEVAHAQGIVHRDLKPENIFLSLDGRVRILDFGIARVLEAVRGLPNLPEKTATKTGVIVGTASYMAPEQATGLVMEVDARADLFGLGATMFRLLAGRTVHNRSTGNQEVIAAATEQAPPLASVAPGVPPQVCAIVDRALAFAKENRFPDAASMRREVHAALAALAAIAGAPIIASSPAGPTSALGTPSRLSGLAPPSASPLSSAAPPSVASPLSSAAPPSRALPTIVDDAPAPPASLPAPLSSAPQPSPPSRTLPDADGSLPRLAFVVGAVALLLGIAIGVAIAVFGG